MDCKTPVSTLQELMVNKGGFLPVYNLTNAMGPSHNPIFEYTVRAGPITATGSGKTKQEAKHNAAQNALKQLYGKGTLNTVSSSMENKSYTNVKESSLSDNFQNKMSSPVSILQEKMIKKGFTPVYNLVKATGECHNPVFEYVVRVNDVTSFGQGHSKREAKHNAAKNALTKLEKLEEGKPVENETKLLIKEGKPVENEMKLLIKEATFDAIEDSYNGTMFTPISKLLNCSRYDDDDSPEFKLTSSSGPQHNPTFEYTVKVKDIAVKGIGKTKKEAKQAAAKNALDKLKEKGLHSNSLDTTANSTYCDDSGIYSFCEDETSISIEETLPNLLDTLIIDKRNELKGLVDINPLSIFEYHNSLKRLDPKKIEKVKNVLNNYEENDLFKLRNVMDILEITYNMNVLSCQEDEDFAFTIKMKSNPVHVIVGIGKSTEEAKQKVILNTFEFLEIMLS